MGFVDSMKPDTKKLRCLRAAYYRNELQRGLLPAIKTVANDELPLILHVLILLSADLLVLI